MSDNEENDEMEEIKISDVKDNIIKKQKEDANLNKKRQRKQNKKKKQAKINLLSKYQDELEEKLNEELTSSNNLIIKEKKEKNVMKEEEIKKPNKIGRRTFKNKRVIVKIRDKTKNTFFNLANNEVLKFKQEHFNRSELNRQNDFLNKI